MRYDLRIAIMRYCISHNLTVWLCGTDTPLGRMLLLRIKNPLNYYADFKAFKFFFIDDYPSGFLGATYIGLDELVYSNKFMKHMLGKRYKFSKYGEGPYENDYMSITPGDVVIDAGSNVGNFTLAALARNAGKVYAFEPQEIAYKYTLTNVVGNNWADRCEVYKKGLSNENRTYDMTVKNCHVKDLCTPDAASSIYIDADDSEYTKVPVDCITLDSFVKFNNINRIDFIKADIEGAERLMLDGARETIKRFHPKLVICTYHLPDDPEVIESLILEIDPSYNIYHTDYKVFAW